MKTENQVIRISGKQDYKRTFVFFALIFWFLIIICSLANASVREEMKESLVYLEISSYGYDQLRPWKNTDVEQKSGVGCATGAYHVITPAWNVTDAKLIRAKVSGQNDYIGVTIKTIDYEVDLALLELDAKMMKKPLRPLRFDDKFERGAKLNYYWLNPDAEITTGQGYMDRAELLRSAVSYSHLLNLIVTNTSQETGIGQVFCEGMRVLGISCWSKGTNEAGLIPSVIIKSFLSRAKNINYPGVPVTGFATEALLDPAMRKYLKLPSNISNGVLVTKVYNIGTGSDLLKKNDVILEIEGEEIDAYGKFLHHTYDRIGYQYLISNQKIRDNINFDVWRDGSRQEIRLQAKNFDVGEMFVPFYEWGQQPEYVVIGGYVFQKLTRAYLTNWGKDWEGKVTPHLFHYYNDMAFKPTLQRREIVILSYVLPSQINLGYTDLSQVVVSKFNGMPISRIGDIIKAQKLNPDDKYDVVEFELDNPKLVIPRQQIQQANTIVSNNYGITKLVHINH